MPQEEKDAVKRKAAKTNAAPNSHPRFFFIAFVIHRFFQLAICQLLIAG
jgi:hypothetical protein